MSETIEHKCSKCGASIVFNPDSQTMICPYCGTLSDVLDTISNDGNLRSKKKRKNANLTDEELQYISEYQCVSCGGEIYADDTTSATLCPYCGNAVILRGRVSGMLRPKKIIPFQISKEQALEGLDRFIGSKHFVHKDFIDRRKLDEVKGLYVPFWIFDAKASGDITYDCVNQRVWTQGDYEYTERKYYSVRRAGDLEFHDLPVTASSKMSDDMMESIEPYDVSMSTNFITGYLSGYIADRYDIEEESAFPRAEKRMFRSVQSELSATVHYDEVRISEKEMDMPWSRSRYVLYPVWMISSVWKDQVFTFAMNGQTGKTTGNLPVSWSRLLSVSALIIAFFTGLFAFISYENGGDINTVMVTIGFILGLAIGIFFVVWYRKQLKTVHYKEDAYDYYDYRISLRIKRDQYLYKEVTSRRINNNQNNGGGFNNRYRYVPNSVSH